MVGSSVEKIKVTVTDGNRNIYLISNLTGIHVLILYPTPPKAAPKLQLQNWNVQIKMNFYWECLIFPTHPFYQRIHLKLDGGLGNVLCFLLKAI